MVHERSSRSISTLNVMLLLSSFFASLFHKHKPNPRFRCLHYSFTAFVISPVPPAHSFQLQVPVSSSARMIRRSTRLKTASLIAAAKFKEEFEENTTKIKTTPCMDRDRDTMDMDMDMDIVASSTDASAPTTPKKRKLSRKRKAIISPSPPSKSQSPSIRKSPKKSAQAPKVILCSSDLAKIAPQNEWKDLNVGPLELRPSATLTTGQCFNWMVVHDYKEGSIRVDGDSQESQQPSSAWGTHNETEWIGPVQDYILSIRETPSTTLYRVLHGPDEDLSDFLSNYFQLSTPLEPLYKSWSANDKRLAKIAPVIPGLRIIQQDPIECMFSFICSSNNNIPRITKMLAAFRRTYGKKMMDLPVRLLDDGIVSGLLDDPMTLYTFPDLDQLKVSTEEELRGMGLGYRAKYIVQTRDLLLESGGEEFLLNLRKEKDSQIVQEALLQFSGIGRKVADCVALFSLDQCEAIPVDVHVQHIASRDYDPSVLGGAKSLTPTIYKRVGDLFRDRFEHAGWAHSLLFVAELPSFRNVLPEDIVAEMDAWREAEIAKKAEAKEAKKKKL